MSPLLTESRVCGWAVLPAELPGSGAAELLISEPIPFQPRWCDRHVLHPPKQEAPYPFTECQCPSTHAAFDAHTPTRAAGAQHHPHPAPQFQVRRTTCVSCLIPSIISFIFEWGHGQIKNGDDYFCLHLAAPVWTCVWMSKHPWTARAARSPQQSSAFPHRQWWPQRVTLICLWGPPTRMLWRCLHCEEGEDRLWERCMERHLQTHQDRLGDWRGMMKIFRVLVWPRWRLPSAGPVL